MVGIENWCDVGLGSVRDFESALAVMVDGIVFFIDLFDDWEFYNSAISSNIDNE